jgi:hypothetical protein
MEDVRNDLAKIQDVAEKQAALKEQAGKPLEQRLRAYQSLSIASFTRSFAAVYALCVVQLFVNTQVFELIRHQRQGRGLFEEAQRRFLSVVREYGGQQEGSELRKLVERVEIVVKAFFGEHSQSEQCDATWVGDAISQIRDELEGNAPNDGLVRTLQYNMTSALVSLLKNRLPDDLSQVQMHVNMGMRGSLDPVIQEHMLVSRMTEIVQSELYAEAFAALLDKAFDVFHHEIVSRAFPTHREQDFSPAGPAHRESEQSRQNFGSTEPHCDNSSADSGSPSTRPTTLPLVKLVPIVSNVFASMSQGIAASGPFHAQTADVEECRNLFEAVGVSGA